MNEERRRYTRIEFDGEAALKQAERSIPVHLIDISLNGVLVETPEDYLLKTSEGIELFVSLASDLGIRMLLSLVHSSSKTLGFKCDSIDMESMTHLRRLIELNMEDPHASERVLEELLVTHESEQHERP